MDFDFIRNILLFAPVAVLFFNLHSRLKPFTNERISVFKDIKSLCSDIEMNRHERLAINNEIEKLILIEATRVRDRKLSKRYLRIMSTNPDLKEMDTKRLKLILECIVETKISCGPDISNIGYNLNIKKYKKKAIKGLLYQGICLTLYFALLYFSIVMNTKGNVLIMFGSYLSSYLFLLCAFIVKGHYPVYFTRHKYDNLLKNLKPLDRK